MRQIAREIDKKFDDYIRSKQRKSRPVRYGIYYPTEVPLCYREIYYRRELVKNFPIELQRKGVIGTILHEHYVKPAIKHIWPDAIERKPERDFNVIVNWKKKIFIRGRGDHLIHLQEGDRRFYVEVKTVANLFAEKEDTWQYEMQVQPCLIGLMADDWYLMVISRQAGSHRTYLYEHDPEVLEEAFERICTVHDFLDKNIIPPAEGLTNPRFRKTMARGKIKFWKCNYCLFSKECAGWEDTLRGRNN